MNKELGKIQKLIDNFIWIHSGNCEHYHDEYLYMKNFLGFSKLKSFNRNHITKHNETFKEAKRKIISNLKKKDNSGAYMEISCISIVQWVFVCGVLKDRGLFENGLKFKDLF